MDSKHEFSPLVALLVAAVALLSTQRAEAHIDMDGVLEARGGDQKAAPCEGLPRSETPYEFEPGATISIGVMEGIPHDGYFRIAFDDDGTDFEDPQSIAPINPDRYGEGQKCQGTPQDRCGKSDFCNMVSDGDGPTVLWDNLEPHLGVDVTLGQTRSWTVQLPDVECDNCTLQVIQVMEDPVGTAHGPFDGENDIYYRCVDIVLKKGVGETPGTVSGPATNNGIECAKDSDAGDSDRPVAADAGRVSEEADGCSAAPGRGAGRAGLGSMLLLAFALLARRRPAPAGRAHEKSPRPS